MTTRIIPLAPQFPLSHAVSSAFFSKTTPTEFLLLDKVDIYVTGHKDGLPISGTNKLITDWWNLNKQKTEVAKVYPSI